MKNLDKQKKAMLVERATLVIPAGGRAKHCEEA